MKESIKLSANCMIGVNDLILKGEIVIFGSTYMANFPLYEFVNKYHFENAIYNRSILLTQKNLKRKNRFRFFFVVL